VEDAVLPDAMAAARLRWFPAVDLPASWGPFQGQGVAGAEGAVVQAGRRISRRWSYRWGERTVHVSLDGPFQGWQSPGGWYRAGGFRSCEESVQAGDPGTSAFAAVSLEHPDGRHGELFSSCCNAAGEVLEPDDFGGRRGWAGDIVDAWRRHSRQRAYQIQLFAAGSGPLALAERAQLQEFFRYVRRQLVAQVAQRSREVPS
jgi:hypothetical protein